RLAWGPSLTFDMRDRWAAFPKRWAAMRNFVFASESNCDAGPGRGLRPQLPAAAHDVLVAGELLRPHRPARRQLAGGDAALGAHADLAAVGELGVEALCITMGASTLAMKRSAAAASSVTIASV